VDSGFGNDRAKLTCALDKGLSDKEVEDRVTGLVKSGI